MISQEEFESKLTSLQSLINDLRNLDFDEFPNQLLSEEFAIEFYHMDNMVSHVLSNYEDLYLEDDEDLEWETPEEPEWIVSVPTGWSTQ